MPEQLPPHAEKSLALARSFIGQVLHPLEAGLENQHAELPKELQKQVREASRKAGFFQKTQPQDLGGNPADALELTVLREAFAASGLRLAGLVFGPGPGLLAKAEGSLRSRYLEPLMAGEKRGAFGFTEPDTAKRPSFAVLADGQLTITGRKSFVTGAADADFVSILVNLEDESGSKLGTAMVVVDMHAKGVQIERSFRSLEGGSHAAVSFEEVRVPADRMLGKPGEGMPRALHNITEIRLALSARATGMCLWAMDLVQEHLLAPHRSRVPLAGREGVRLRFADLQIQIYAARSCLYRTARLAAAGARAVNEVAACKVFCTETAGRVIDTAVQLLGGQALIEGHPLERAYRSVRSMRLAEGASDILRLNLAKGRLELGEGRL